MAWDLRNTVSMPGEKTGPAVIRFNKNWYWTRSEFEALSREDAHGVKRVYLLILLPVWKELEAIRNYKLA